MNTIYCNIKNGSFIYDFPPSKDMVFIRLLYYIQESWLSTSLLDPSLSKSEYLSGNFYYSKQDDLYFYIAVDPYDEDEHDEEEDPTYEPTIILINTLYGLGLAFNTIIQSNAKKFSITKEYKRYIVQSDDMDPIVIDPDLGYLYNDTIPRIIVRKIDGKFVPEIYSTRHHGKVFLYSNPGYEELELFYNLWIKNYNPKLIYTLRTWTDDINKHKDIIQNNMRISNGIAALAIALNKKKDTKKNDPWLVLDKQSLIAYLQAWEAKLQFSDAFTIVFLGSTVRYFEGEPLPLTSKSISSNF